jgi:cell division protein FtsB
MAVKGSLALLLMLLLGLQYKAWFGDVGYLANSTMRAEVAQQKQRTEVLRQRNRILTAEVLALQRGLEAVESRARSSLGMIKQGETFYLVNPDQ